MRCRSSYVVRFFLATLLVFIVAKVVFMLANSGEHSFSTGDVAVVIGHGLSLDFSTALYFLIVPFLLTVASVWMHIPWWLYRTYYAIVAIAFSLAFVADTSLYDFWKFKLDASCLQYLDTPTEAMASVTYGYLVLRLFFVVAVAVAIYLLYKCCCPAVQRQPVVSIPPKTVSPFVETFFYILFTPLIVIGIRGGLDESTTNIGQVYYSSNQFLNHSAVNPVFSFLSSLGKTGDYIVVYDYYSEEECADLTDIFLTTSTEHSDTLLTSERPNIVIIIMEGCGGQFTEIGGNLSITPRLNQLAREGVYFTECYANSWRTDKGVVSVLSGYPAFPVTSVMKIPEKSRKLPSIASSLAAVGYANSFFYGGDINFTNMRSYLLSTGYEHLSWKSNYPMSQQKSAQWGVRDDLMFSSLLADIKSEGDKRWMKTLLTLSSHEPWDVPDKVERGGWNTDGDEVYNAFHYLDRCIGDFIDSLRKTPQWDNLLVIILPDHGFRYRGIDETTRLYNHIPMIWVGGAVRSPQRIERLCSQSDLAATLLGQMGLPHTGYTFSRDVLSCSYKFPMAYHTYNNGVTLYDTTGFVVYDLDAQHVIAHEGPDTDRLLRQAKALLQLTSRDLKQK